MNIIALAFDLATSVEQFIEKAKRFYYHVMLLGHACPNCQGPLSMIGEGKCHCDDCGCQFDPTIEFQQCPACRGKIKLRIRRYQCQKCGQDVRSRFLFDSMVFDTEYFKIKMAQSRQRKSEQRERVRQMLAESRSAALQPEPLDLDSVPGLLAALNSLTADLETAYMQEAKSEFNLNRYESHIQAHMRDFPIRLGDIPPLNENNRKDLIWRFIAIIFLAHAGTVDVLQDGQDILVKKHAIDRKRQGLLGETETVDGIERPLGRVEAG